MKRTRQCQTLSNVPSTSKNSNSSDSSDIDDSDKDTNYIPEVKSHSRTENNEPSTSKHVPKKKKTLKSSCSNTGSSLDNATERHTLTRKNVLVHSKYSQYFEISSTVGPNNTKSAICLLCKSANINSNIKMRQSNTSGLKWHLNKHHSTESNSLFPSQETKTPTNQLKLDAMFTKNLKKVSASFFSTQ